MHCLVCNGINCIIAYRQTKRGGTQQTLILLLLLLLLLLFIIIIIIIYYYYYFIILYGYCFYSRKKKVKMLYIFTERLFMLNDIIWVMQLYLKNTCEGVQFKNFEGIQ